MKPYIESHEGRNGWSASADVFVDISGRGDIGGRRHVATFYAPRRGQAEALARSWLALIDAVEGVRLDEMLVTPYPGSGSPGIAAPGHPGSAEEDVLPLHWAKNYA